jgi:hypothetical protein
MLKEYEKKNLETKIKIEAFSKNIMELKKRKDDSVKLLINKKL